MAFNAHAQSTERVIKNDGKRPVLWAQGLDPMSYYRQGQAFYGRPEIRIEDQSSNFIFYFVSEDNKQAFLQGGKVNLQFLPQLGGYDPYGLAFGEFYPGSLNIFTIYQNRLYFFYSLATQRLWQQNPDSYLDPARKFYDEWLKAQQAKNTRR